MYQKMDEAFVCVYVCVCVCVIERWEEGGGGMVEVLGRRRDKVRYTANIACKCVNLCKHLVHTYTHDLSGSEFVLFYKHMCLYLHHLHTSLNTCFSDESREIPRFLGINNVHSLCLRFLSSPTDLWHANSVLKKKSKNKRNDSNIFAGSCLCLCAFEFDLLLFFSFSSKWVRCGTV